MLREPLATILSRLPVCHVRCSPQFSPDGAEVATHTNDGETPIWPKAGNLHDTVSVWTADGSGEPRVYVRIGSNGGLTQLWKASGSDELVALTGYLVRLGLRFPPCGEDLAATSDGTLLIDGYWDDAARVHRVDGSEEPIVLSHGGNRVGTAAFSSDSTIVATKGNGPARIWPVGGTRSEPLIIRDHQGLIRGPSFFEGVRAAFSQDGAFVATASHDGTVHIQRTDGSGVGVVHQHASKVMSVSFNPDGNRLGDGNN